MHFIGMHLSRGGMPNPPYLTLPLLVGMSAWRAPSAKPQGSVIR